MIFVDIKEFAQKTIQRFGTHDPFDICNQLGIVILYLPLGRMRGYCYSNENGKVVVLHDGLAEHEARVVCAHELGHVLLHPNLNRIYLDTSTFVCERKLENEVNAFAVCLLFPDDNELLENCSTISELSIYMGVRLELAQLRSMYIGV
ncbi:MAG: ImmA/IrrE family metallo-endopeptidase [Ruthenibacterium lactatiformans]